MSDLWEHQTKFVDLAEIEPKNGALFDPGCGKTRAVIETLRREYNKQKRIVPTLIFAPISVCPGWKKQFEIYSSVPQDKVLSLTDSGAKRTKQIATKMESGRAFIAITNYESVQIESFYQQILRFSPEIIICDEAHRLKDPNGKRAKRIYPISVSAERKSIMTGTYSPNSLMDVFGQFKFLDPNIFGASFWKFRNLYFYDKNAGMRFGHFPDWRPRPEAAEMIAKKIAKYCVIAKKEDCLDLPEMIDVQVPVDLTGEQKRCYSAMEKDFITESKGVVSVAEFAMTKVLRLQQITAGFLSGGEGSEPLWFDDVTRLKALSETLESLNKKRCLIWTNFIPTYKKLARICEDQGLRTCFITGDESFKQKQESIQKFIDGSAEVVIANPAAAGEGIDGLQVCNYAIWYTKGYNFGQYEQARARIHRGGSEIHESVTNYHLYANKTIDHVIEVALSIKKNLSEEILKWVKMAS